MRWTGTHAADPLERFGTVRVLLRDVSRGRHGAILNTSVGGLPKGGAPRRTCVNETRTIIVSAACPCRRGFMVQVAPPTRDDQGKDPGHRALRSASAGLTGPVVGRNCTRSGMLRPPAAVRAARMSRTAPLPTTTAPVSDMTSVRGLSEPVRTRACSAGNELSSDEPFEETDEHVLGVDAVGEARLTDGDRAVEQRWPGLWWTQQHVGVCDRVDP